MSQVKYCDHCGMDTAVRNPSGHCDHLYYPDNCKVCRGGKKPAECGCSIVNGGSYEVPMEIKFCPLHQNAGRLLEAAKCMSQQLHRVEVNGFELPYRIEVAWMKLSYAIEAASEASRSNEVRHASKEGK